MDEIDNNRKLFLSTTALWPPAILLTSIGLILSFYALNPGLMSYDTFYMYDQGVRWQFNDWHHPFLPILMSFSRMISGDTALLLFLQLSSLWAGIYLFAVSLKKQIGRWALLSILIGYTPVVLNQSGFLGKTPLQTALFLLVFGSCYYYYCSPKKPTFKIQILLLFGFFLGTTIRTYSYISAIPIAMFSVYVVMNNHTLKFVTLKCFLIAFSILLLFFMVEKVIVYKVLNAERTFKSQALFKYDLAGIMAMSGKLYVVNLLQPEYSTHKAILKHYKKVHADSRVIGAVFGKDKNLVGHVYQTIFNKEEQSFLFHEWVRAIVENPVSYLKHRYHGNLLALGISNGTKGLIDEAKYQKDINMHGIKKNINFIWKFFKKYNFYFEKTILLKPWFWLLLNTLLFIFSLSLLCFRKISRLILPHAVLNFSGTLFFIVYLFIGLSNNLRFVYWGMVATAFAFFGIISTIINNFKKQT